MWDLSETSMESTEMNHISQLRFLGAASREEINNCFYKFKRSVDDIRRQQSTTKVLTEMMLNF